MQLALRSYAATSAKYAMTATPSTIRYQPNGLKSCFFTKPMRKRIAASETRNATTQPVSRMAASEPENALPLRKNFTRRRPEAPTMTGIAR